MKTWKIVLIIALAFFLLHLGVVIYSNHQITIQNQYTEPTGTVEDAYNRLPEHRRIIGEAFNPFWIFVPGLATWGVIKVTQRRKRRNQ